MTERPIVFRDWEVRAALQDRKTQARRPIKKSIDMDGSSAYAVCAARDSGWIAWFSQRPTSLDKMAEFTRKAYQTGFPCPYGEPGDRLRVRDTWRTPPFSPAIYMPRCSSRLTLEVTGVRVERVQDISDAEALGEGVYRAPEVLTERGHSCLYETSTLENMAATPRESYRLLWDSLYAKTASAWANNPWVWVVEFKKS